MNVTSLIIVDYENIANCKLCENKPNSEPIKPNQSQYKANQTQNKPKQTQFPQRDTQYAIRDTKFKANQTQPVVSLSNLFQRQKNPANSEVTNCPFLPLPLSSKQPKPYFAQNLSHLMQKSSVPAPLSNHPCPKHSLLRKTHLPILTKLPFPAGSAVPLVICVVPKENLHTQLSLFGEQQFF